MPSLPVILGPNITGKFGALWAQSPGNFIQEGALYTDKIRAASLTGDGATNSVNYLQFDASRSSSVYGNATTVQPSSLIFNYVIKY